MIPICRFYLVSRSVFPIQPVVFWFFFLLLLPDSNVFAVDLGPALRFTSPLQSVYVDPFPKAPASKITIEFRVKIESAGSGLQSLVGDNGGLDDSGMKIYLNGDTLKVYACLNVNNQLIILSSDTLEPHKWYHIAWVIDYNPLSSSAVIFYINGKETAKGAYYGVFDNSDSPFYLGYDGTVNGVMASMDEVRIWHTVRTVDQLRFFMFRNILPTDADYPDLAAYWRLDEGVGTTVTDFSSYDRNGTIQGSAQWVELEECLGDFDGDTNVDGLDLVSFTNAFGLTNCGSENWTCPGDFNADRDINGQDMELFAECFGRDDCRVKHVYSIVDVMVAEYPYTIPASLGYTGLTFGQCTEPYIEDFTGIQLQSVDVNTGIGGSTTGIWVKYEYLPINWSGPVLDDYAVTHWVEWIATCPAGWEIASGESEGKPGALTTGTDTSCWRNGLCVHYEPLSDTETFITNVCISDGDGTCPVFCETEGVYWPMERDTLDIHAACGDWRYAYLCYNNAKAWTPMPATIEFGDSDKHLLLQKYAPRVWLAENEIYMPSSVEWAFPYLERFQHPDMNYWLRTKEELEEPSSVLPFFAGDLDSAPVYAFWLKKEIPVGATTINVIDLAYFFYYPYNRGKEVINTIFGNHVGDWEHVTVRLTWQYDAIIGWEVKPFQAYIAAHDFGGAYDWDDSRLQKVDDTHPVVYSAWGSHGLWIDAGRHEYGEVCWLICEDLVDWCSEGYAWDTWSYLVGFDFTTKQGLAGEVWPTWMSDTFTEAGDCGDPSDPGCGAIYRWGNIEDGLVFGYYRLTNGPTGPISKEVMNSLDLQ